MKSLQRLGLASLATVALVAAAIAAPPISGAIFTTDSTGGEVNQNIYTSKLDVYLNGGPSRPGAAGLPPGDYYVKVTDPSGHDLLGTSIGTADETPIRVLANGDFEELYQLFAIVVLNGVPGYDDTTNNGGEYKVWVSSVPDFENNSTKTDNFKVKADEDEDDDEDPVAPIVHVYKFYDANANGAWDDTESAIEGWKVDLEGASGYTDVVYTSWTATLDPDDYTFTEGTPVETNWLHTTDESVTITLANGDEKDVTFGNLCLGAGGGYTLGFWSNKNGQKLIGSDDLAALCGLNLYNGSGVAFNPTSAAQVKTWLLSGTATNMSYMLSVQLCAMKLNVHNGSANGSALVYAPGLGTSGLVDVDGDGTSDFLSVADLIAAADAELGTHSTAYAGDAWRGYQEALKNALDAGNNNLNFVQSTPGAFSF